MKLELAAFYISWQTGIITLATAKAVSFIESFFLLCTLSQYFLHYILITFQKDKLLEES